MIKKDHLFEGIIFQNYKILYGINSNDGGFLINHIHLLFMGIKGFYKLLEAADFQAEKLTDLNNVRLAVDARSLIYKFAYGFTDGELLDGVVCRVLTFQKKLTERGVSLIYFIFDGNVVPIEKNRVLLYREKCKQKAKERLDALRPQVNTNTDKILKLQCASRGIPETVYHEIIARLKKLELHCFVSESEADFALAYLSENKMVDLVMSDDADLLVIGSTRIIRHLPRLIRNSTPALVYDSDAICKHLLTTHDNLQNVSCILGCDYCAGIKGCGVANTLKYIKNQHTSIEEYMNTWTAEQSSRFGFPHYADKTEYLDSVRKSKQLFTWRPDGEHIQAFANETNKSDITCIFKRRVSKKRKLGVIDSDSI